jgi:hypothetical protein
MGLVENLKDAADIAQKIGNIELYRKIVELEGEVIELTRKLRLLEDQNENLNRALEVKKEVTYNAPFYYAKGEQNPYCSKCWELDKKLVHISRGIHMSSGYTYSCPNCKNTFFHNK